MAKENASIRWRFAEDDSKKRLFLFDQEFNNVGIIRHEVFH